MFRDAGVNVYILKIIMKILFQKHSRKLITIIIVILFSTSLWQLASAGWIQGKALIAQQLLNHSWNKTLIDQGKTNSQKAKAADQKTITHKPWPWADTWPVAKLLVPQHGIEQIILAGDSGNSLAFGPGYSLAGAEPNTIGTTVVSAHRDTHFQFLKDIKINDTIYIQTSDSTISYRVFDLQVVEDKTHVIPNDSDDMTLVLVTCYPFDAIRPGGSSRYLVYAARS